MTQAEAIRRRLEAEEEQAKAQEKEEGIRRRLERLKKEEEAQARGAAPWGEVSAEWDDGWWWSWSESRWKH